MNFFPFLFDIMSSGEASLSSASPGKRSLHQIFAALNTRLCPLRSCPSFKAHISPSYLNLVTSTRSWIMPDHAFFGPCQVLLGGKGYTCPPPEAAVDFCIKEMGCNASPPLWGRVFSFFFRLDFPPVLQIDLIPRFWISNFAAKKLW